jgi:hypothetical protein
MKLVNRKTRKAIEKGVRKAFKKHGPALMASLVSSLASTTATLAATAAPGKQRKSNLADIVERAGESVAGTVRKKASNRKAEKKRTRLGGPPSESTARV